MGNVLSAMAFEQGGVRLASTTRGLSTAAMAYVWWGLSPLFWKALGDVAALDALGYRVVATFVLLLLLVVARRQSGSFVAVVASPRGLATSLLTAALIAVNWGVYIWAVEVDRVTEASLGYFMTPLINVLFGVLFLGETLRRAQWLAVAFAALGVLWLTVWVGTLPWVALALAGTFGLYALLRKTMKAGPLVGLSLEMSVLVLPSLLLLGARGEASALATYDPLTLVLLASTAVITAVPLLLFAAAARAIPLSLLGQIQYLAPTLQFLLGVFYFKETFEGAQLLGFALVWLGVVVFSWEGLARRLRHRSPS